MKVRVKDIEGLIGFYDNQRRRPGDVFEISDRKTNDKQKYPDAYSDKWMDIVDEEVKPKKAEPKEEEKVQPIAPSRAKKVTKDAVEMLKEKKEDIPFEEKKPSGDEEVI